MFKHIGLSIESIKMFRTTAFISPMFAHPCLNINSHRRSSIPGKKAIVIKIHAAGLRRVTTFHGVSVNPLPAAASESTGNTLRMSLSLASLPPETLYQIAGGLFATALIPYLTFLHYLGREELECPEEIKFGFQFLLVFILSSFPMEEVCRVLYHDDLLNVDWLHGMATSLLATTNLLIVLGIRKAIFRELGNEGGEWDGKPKLSANALPLLSVIFMATGALSGYHEPFTALSIPTWGIHLCCVLEWTVAMGLMWKYAETSGKEIWKSFTWAMLPFHAGGITACTYHFFYNNLHLSLLVPLQAFFTFSGNVAIAYTAYRAFGKMKRSDLKPKAKGSLRPFGDFPDWIESDSNRGMFTNLLILAAVGASLCKWGSLYVSHHFEPSYTAALAAILVPSALTGLTWIRRSNIR